MSSKIDPKDFVFGAEVEVEVTDIDLDKEEFHLRDGRQLTEELAGKLSAEARAEIGRRNLIPGRKSLSGGTTHSPVIRVRVPAQLHRAVEQRAAEGVTISALTREALELYLAS